VIYIDNSPSKGYAGKESDFLTGETSLGRVVFNVGNPSEITFIFKLKTFLLSFDVVDGEGNPIPSATVTVVPVNQYESSAVVLPQGANQFEVGAGESYSYTVTAVGYEMAEGTVNDVGEDQVIEVIMNEATTEPELFAYWNFNSNVPAENQNWDQPIASTLGEGVLTYTFTQAYSFGGTNINGVEGEENGGSFAPRGGVELVNNGKYFILSFSTEGYDDIHVSYPTRRTGTGFTHQQVEYTINGTDWLTKETFDISAYANNWLVNQLVDIDFTGVEGVGNNPGFAVRIILTGASTEAGNNRIDNIRVVGTADQGNLPPIVMFNPANGAVGVPVNVQPTISFNKPVRNLDDSEITNDNVAGLISFSDGTDPVGFTATINEAKTLITIVPNALLLKGEEYTITLSPVEDENGNATDTKSATFTTELPSGVATLATFTLGGEDALQLLGVVVNDPVTDAGATLFVDDFTGFVGIEAIPTDANATVTVTINGTIVDEADYATQTFANGDVVLATVVAEDGISTKYYKVTMVIDDRVLELTSPLGGEIFHTGDELTITWNSESIANVNLWLCDADGEPLNLINDEGPIPAANGTYSVTIENGIDGSFHIRVSDAIDPTFYDQTATTITIVDEMMPSMVSRYPAHGASGVSIVFTLSIGFDEHVTNGTGQFIIRKMSDDSQAIAVTSQNFTINGGAATLSVANLAFSTEYYIDAVEGVFEDTYGNPSPAITKSGALQWHFTTMDEPDTDLFITEYIEGSGNNKALEIYNPTGIPISLANYRIAQSNNGGGWQYYHYFPSGAVIAPHDVWVIITDAIAPTIFDPANADEVLAYPSVVHFNGNDARAIERTDNGTDYYIIDVFGDPDSDANIDVAGVTGAAVDHTIVRKSSVLTGNTDWAASAGTNADDSEWIVYPINTFDYLGWHFYGLSQEADIIAFSVEYQMAPAVIDAENATITLEVLHDSGLDAIVPVFTLSAGATAYINGEEQVSGTSVVDFTNPVVYTIVAEDGETEREWTVTITEAAVSTEAEILSFAVEGQASEEVINSQNATVTLQVMPGTDLTALAPQITISLGATIDPASGVAQDFSQPVHYTVTAQDGVTQKIWTVTITTIDLTPIHDIQFTEDESGDSPFAGQTITTSGIVTALHYNAPGGEFQGFFIQDGVGAWNGLYVYDKNLVSIAPSIGDYVVVSGMIKEYYGLTELTFDSQSGVHVEFVVISQGNELPEPFEVSTHDVNGEPWESVLVKLTNAQCIDTNVGFGQKRVDDDSGPTLIDDDIYSAPLSLHVRYDIIGIAHYSYEEYKVLPRSVNDVSVTSVNTVAWGANINTFPNPFTHTIWIDNAHEVVRVNIFNLMGQQLMSIPVNSEDRLSISTDNLPFGVYLISIENARGERAVRKMIKNRY
ncbi:MAG TPA: Ig-like domain-containing protein, partial [Tenuifilaceae bacterium]|nr:Ig-like domain-containing protein [Tenuifilaceae bacterium]